MISSSYSDYHGVIDPVDRLRVQKYLCLLLVRRVNRIPGLEICYKVVLYGDIDVR